MGMTIKMRPPHRGQIPILYSLARFIVALCARRFGKTQLGIDKTTKAVIEDPGMYWWVGLSWRSASLKRAWRLLKKRFRQVPGVIIREVDKEIHLPNGSMIWMRTAEAEDSLDGEGLKGVVLDECTMMKEVIWTQHIRPALADFRGWALFIGVPKGKNWVYRLFTRGRLFVWEETKYKKVTNGIDDPDGSLKYPGWASYQCPTSANPFIEPAEIAEAENELPDRVYRQEFMAEILDDDSAVFGDLKQVIYGELEEPKHNARYYGGIDPARLKDYFVIIIVEEQGHVVAYDRMNKRTWEHMYDRTEELLKKYNDAQAYVDSTGVGDPVQEALWNRHLNVNGIDYRKDNNKVRLVETLIMAVERKTVSWPKELNTLTKEMEIFEADIRPTGRIKYSAPEGEHDDCVNSLALANMAREKLGITTVARYI